VLRAVGGRQSTAWILGCVDLVMNGAEELDGKELLAGVDCSNAMVVV
jgi:hypothetical protein